MNANLPISLSDQTLSDYIKQISTYPILAQEEEYSLANRVYNYQDKDAAHTLVTSHLRLVVKIAMGMKGYGIAVMDLISEGNIGLMHAVKKFKPDLGYRLSTYAMWWIKASMQEFIMKSWSLVKIGTTVAQKKLFFNLNKIKKKINLLEGKSPVSNLSDEGIEKVADELRLSRKDVQEMDSRLTLSDASLDSTMLLNSGEESSSLLDTIQDDSSCNQESKIIENSENDYRRTLLQEALSNLNERERDIVYSRHLYDKPVTLDDLSKKYSVSRERIRQIEARALDKVKAACVI